MALASARAWRAAVAWAGTSAMATPLMVRPEIAPGVAAAPTTSLAKLELPSALVWALVIAVTEISWPAFAPTWKAWPVKLPSSSLVPLNSVCVATRWISLISCCTSEFSAARSEAEFVAFELCTASSRMRCRLDPSSPKAPSATWASEMPSLALRAAWLRPRIWVVKRSEMARPAASSRALLMRRPEDRRWMVVAKEALLVCRLRWAFSEIVLVLMMAMTVGSSRVGRGPAGPAPRNARTRQGIRRPAGDPAGLPPCCKPRATAAAPPHPRNASGRGFPRPEHYRQTGLAA